MIQQEQTILIVDNCPEDRETYRSYLLQDSRYTYKIFEEESGEQALELCRRLKPDAILLELQLPDINGLDFLSVLKTQTGNPILPVVMLSKQGDESVAVQAIKRGAQDYLMKEKTSPEILCFAIHNVLENNRLHGELEKSELRFRTSVENMLDCFGIYKSIRDEKGRIVDFRIEYVNRAACESPTIKKEEQLGRHFGEIFPGYRLMGLFDEYCQVVETGKPLYKVGFFGEDVSNQHKLNRAFEVRATKLEDGFVACWRDVSDRQHDSAALQETQRLIQQVADTNPGIFYIYDLNEKRNIYINDRVAEVLGYTPEAIRDMGTGILTQLMHPEDLNRYPDHVRKLFDPSSDGKVFEFEYRMRHNNGEWRWVLSRDTVFKRNPDSSLHQILGTALDITSSKQTEQELRYSNERFQMAAAAVNCLIYDWDIEKNIVERSEGLTHILGYSLEETEPTQAWWKERIHPDDYQRMCDEVEVCLTTENRYAVEYRIRHKDGRYLYILDQGIVVRNARGNPIRAVGSTTDITARKHAEEEVRRLNREMERRLAELQTLLDVIPVGIGIAHDPECRLITHNPFLAEMLRVPLNKNSSKSVPTEEQPPFKVFRNGEELPAEELPMQYAAIHAVEVRDAEIDIVHPDGTTIKLSSNVRPLFDEQGKVRGTVGAFADITERTQLIAREKAAREKAEEANRTKDEFLAIVSHELRSPLNAVLGWANLLRTRKFDQVTIDRAIETIERNARSLAQLIEDLVDITRLIRGHFHLHIAEVNLNTVIEAAIDVVRPTAEAKSIQIQLKFDVSSCTVSGDFHRLQQIVWNLLSNAVKFTPESGKIKVSLSVNYAEEKHFAQIEVTDTGKGITAEFLPYVFERFRQADSKITLSNNGLGLGLAIARQLVELHGGTIHAASPGEGQGATFTVRLPVSH